MREKLNENPVAQLALLGALVLVVGFLLLHGLGSGGSGEEGDPGEVPTAAEATTEAPAVESGVIESEPTAATTASPVPGTGKVPKDVTAAYDRGDTIALLVYRTGGIDDKLTRESTETLRGVPKVAFFKTSVDDIARYAGLTGPLGVSLAPALVVVSPKKLAKGGAAPATVDYGFQTGEDVRQAIFDARYEGPELTYAPN